MPAKKSYINWAKVPVLISAAELAVLFNANETTVRKWLLCGMVPGAKKIGKLWFVERDTLQRHFEGESAAPRMSDIDAEHIADIMARKLTSKTKGEML